MESIKWKYADKVKATKNVLASYKVKKKEALTCPEAQKVVHWFESAWELLEEQQQLKLKAFYMGETLKDRAEAKLMVETYESASTIHRTKDHSLLELSYLLFGN